MHKFRAITSVSLKSYSTVRKKNVPGNFKRIPALQNEEPDDLYEDQDMDKYESDFMTVGQSYIDYEREETREKELLQRRIVAKKYFKTEPQPNFLTFEEKELIKTLHRSDPDEWTFERLSASFPALPDTIKKVVRANWKPTSVETVLKYDNRVINNWKEFRSGKLTLNPKLQAHLMKFKDRKISVTDRHLLAEKFVRPDVSFPKPRSSLFSNIIQSYLDAKEHNIKLNQKLLTNDAEVNNNSNVPSTQSNVTSIEEPEKEISKAEVSTAIMVHNEPQIINESKKNRPYKLQTCSDFIKNNLEKIYKKSPMEGRTLLEIYKKQLNESDAALERNDCKAQNITELDSIKELSPHCQNNITSTKMPVKETLKPEVDTLVSVHNEQKVTDKSRKGSRSNRLQTFSDSMINNPENICEELCTEDEALSQTYKKQLNKSDTMLEKDGHTKKHVMKSGSAKELLASDLPQKEEHATSVIVNEGNNELDTYIKVWNKKTDKLDSYPMYIRIPKKLYKKGMLYKVEDRYYDDDGEFLYRTPGLTA